MSKIALDLGFIQIYWYSITMFLGILAGSIVAYREIKRQKVSEDFFINLIFYGILFGLIGARLYYVAFHFDYYRENPLEILEVWNGGLAIHGAILFASLWFIIYTKKYKQKTLKIFDIVVVGLILGQAIGRWGNFFNQEAFGAITTKAALLKDKVPEFIINQMYIDGVYRQPTFLYESLWDIFGFIALLIVRRYKYLKTGQLTAFYLMWYSAGRFVIEGYRSDSLMLGNFKVAQIVSVILFIVGLLIFLLRRRGSKFENLYRNENDEKDEKKV